MNIFLGCALIVFTVFAGCYLERRQFMRMNAAGIQEFNSYGAMLKCRIFEGTVKLLSVAAGIGGIVILFKALS